MAKRKYSYQFIKEFIESVDYVFLLPEKEYKNVSTPLKLRCPKGHEYTTRWAHFYHSGFRCKPCNKLSLVYVKGFFSVEKYTLLESEYINSTSKLRYECPLGHRHAITWASWRSGSRCPYCVKVPFREVVAGFNKEGYKVLSKEEDYIKCKSKFEYECPYGHYSSMRWYNFKYGFRCPRCSVGNISKISQVWLDTLNISQEFREYRISMGDTFLRVDGFDPKTNTVYEFLGDYWHGNPEVYNSTGVNKISKKSYGNLYTEWLHRKEILEQSGFKVVYIWERDFSNV